MFRQRREQKRQARGLRMMLHDRSIDRPEKPLRVDLDLRLLPLVAFVTSLAGLTG
jgi:hypothetical protein